MTSFIACSLCGSPSNHLAEFAIAASLALVATAIVRIARRRLA